MSDAFGKIIAVFICVYLMFIAPVMYMQREELRIEDSYILSETSIFIENIKNTGIITKEEYDKYVSSIAAMSSIYTIEMVHSKHTYDYEHGEIIFAADNYYNIDITNKLAMEGTYYLEETDYFKITVYRDEIPIVFVGGGIKNEAY